MYHRYFGKRNYTQKIQDQIDPYMANFYDYFSVAAGYTKPYLKPGEGVPARIQFTVASAFIPEGEADNTKVIILYIVYYIYIYISLLFIGCSSEASRSTHFSVPVEKF